MPESVIYKLRKAQLNTSPSNQVETVVNMKFNFGYYEIKPGGKKEYIPLTYPTGAKIKPCFWNPKPLYRAKQTRHIDYISINTRLDNLEGMAKKAYRRMINEGIKPTPLDIKNAIDEMDGGVKNEDKDTFELFIKRFIQDIESGERLFHSKRYSLGTIKNYKGTQSQLNEYQKNRRRRLNWDHITHDFYLDFIKFFSNKNYSPNTIGRHIKCLKTMMGCALEEGLHTNREFQNKSFKVLKERVQSVYLNDAELKKIYDLDLSDKPRLDLARDIFLVGCYTAQRFSDYSRIKRTHSRKLSNGILVIDLIQKKTGERVIIPVRPELKNLLKKYNWELPKSYEQKVNERIKKIVRLAEIIELINVENTRGGLVVRSQKEKCDLVKTHTARRSGCTNMYLAGIPTIDIMKISGHKSEREFLNYIKVTKEETATNLSNHPYFKSPTLKIAK